MRQNYKDKDTWMERGLYLGSMIRQNYKVSRNMIPNTTKIYNCRK